MWSLILSGMSSVGGLLAMLAVVSSLVGVGAYEQHKIDESKLLKVEAGYKDAELAAATEAAATQHAADQASIDAAASETAAQTALTKQLQGELSGVSRHVTTSGSNCITWGLVRVLDSTVLGISADALDLPAGATDATCSTVTAVALANSIINNYGIAKVNAQMLKDFQTWANEVATATKGHAK